ncbi:MAG TPA: class I SAM-dependent methyltransferase [Blastocatellia bacterium]|nr:class I SAM-dependent methyltransferase [Blastocatellia bacterium]
MKGYKNDLAYIHDVGFGEFARRSAPGLLEILRGNGIRGGLVADLGCGSGIWALELARAGYEAMGIDISPAMIEIARRRVPSGEFRVGSLLKMKLPRCVAVTSLGECLNYLFDRSNSLGQLRTFFRRVYDALEPGGVFIFDIAEPGRGKGPRQKHREGKDWAVLVEVDEDTRTNRLTRRITTFRKEGASYRRDEESHQLQLYKRSEVTRELRSAGFRVRTLTSYGGQEMIDGCVAFVAQKARTSRHRHS